MEGFCRTVAFFQKDCRELVPGGRRPGAFSTAVPAGEKEQRPTALKSRAAAQTDSAPGPASAAACPIKEGCHVLWDVFAIFFYRHTKEEHYARHCHHPRPVRFHPV